MSIYKKVRTVGMVNLIHKSDVYFDVTDTEVGELALTGNAVERMHHGEIYIYLDQIYLHEGNRWYKANIKDIKDIKSLASHKQIRIHFLNFDLILFSKDYSHLLALRDFLYLSQINIMANNFMISDLKTLGGGHEYR